MLDALVQQEVVRYWTNFVSERSNIASGERGLLELNSSRVPIMSTPPLYDTTGEVADVMSTPGLERMARFLAFFVKESGKAPREKLQ